MASLLRISVISIQCFALTACAATAGPSSRGAAAGANTVGTDSSLERCAKPLGTVAIAYRGDESWRSRFSSDSGTDDVRPILGALAQKSNCFVVSSAGNDGQEKVIDEIVRKERNSGETRPGSRLEKGQVVAVDLIMYPSITFPESNDAALTNIACAAFSGLSGVACPAVNIQTKSATVNLALFDKRARIQLATAQGSASRINWGIGGLGIHDDAFGALAAYARTPQGSATIEAFANAHNQLALALRNYRAQKVDGGLGQGGALEVQGRN